MNTNRCSAITSKNKLCKLKCKDDNEFCHIHLNNDEDEDFTEMDGFYEELVSFNEKLDEFEESINEKFDKQIKELTENQNMLNVLKIKTENNNLDLMNIYIEIKKSVEMDMKKLKNKNKRILIELFVVKSALFFIIIFMTLYFINHKDNIMNDLKSYALSY
jgi:hypothetical protein